MAKWDHLRSSDKPSGEYKEAVDEAKKAIKPVRKKSGKDVLPPLVDCTQEQSTFIRDMVALEFSGYSLSAIAEKLECEPSKLTYYRQNKPKALEEARKALAEEAQLRYWQNLWVIRTALTEAGPRAVRTLCDVMDSKNAAPNHRLRAAETVLKLVDVDFSVSSGSEDLKFEIAETIRQAREESKAESILEVEAEDAEVIEDGSN